jgi:hypothetical protein
VIVVCNGVRSFRITVQGGSRGPIPIYVIHDDDEPGTRPSRADAALLCSALLCSTLL